MAKSKQSGDYNYRRFIPAEYDYDNFSGRSVGDSVDDVKLLTMAGEIVNLSDYLDQPLVLETGSMTCPMYAKSASPMQAFAAKYPSLNFILLYVREAHPGEKLPAHKSIEEKLSAANKTFKSHGEKRTVLADQVSGEAHNMFGDMPNSIYIIDPSGEILFRSIWNNTNLIDEVLEKISKRQPVKSTDMKPVPPGLRGPRTLLLGGWVAVWDFIIGLPELLAKHRKAGNL